jgi:hypothetical protein
MYHHSRVAVVFHVLLYDLISNDIDSTKTLVYVRN